MPIFLLIALGVGTAAILISRSSKAAGTGTDSGRPSEQTQPGPPIVADPRTVDPSLSEPRTVTNAGVVSFDGGWAEVVAYRLLRYKLGAQEDLPGGGARRSAMLAYKGDAKDLPTSVYETALGWIKQQNIAGNLIVVSSSLAYVNFTESKSNVTRFNPSLPEEVSVLAVAPGSAATYAKPGSGLALLVGKPDQLAKLPDTTKDIVTAIVG